MRSLCFVLITMLTFFMNPETARSEGADFPAPLLVQQELSAADFVGDQGEMRIDLGKGVIYRLEAMPREAAQLKPYNGLSSEQQELFLSRRQRFLTQIARALQASRLALGAGSLVGSSFRFVKDGLKKTLGAPVPEAVESPSFRERSQRVVQTLLTNFDRQMWAQAPLMVSANEFGISASVALIAVGGYLKKGFGGAQELGVSFAFNTESKALVFELFHSSEKFRTGEPFAAVLAAAPRVGVQIARREMGPEGLKSEGHIHGLPVIPAYAGAGEDSLNVGAMLTLGIPPTPIADFLGYMNEFDKTTLIRVTLSPIVKSFIRVEFGDARGAYRAVLAPFSTVMQAITSRVQALRFGRCESLFAAN